MDQNFAERERERYMKEPSYDDICLGANDLLRRGHCVRKIDVLVMAMDFLKVPRPKCFLQRARLLMSDERGLPTSYKIVLGQKPIPHCSQATWQVCTNGVADWKPGQSFTCTVQAQYSDWVDGVIKFEGVRRDLQVNPECEKSLCGFLENAFHEVATLLSTMSLESKAELIVRFSHDCGEELVQRLRKSYSRLERGQSFVETDRDITWALRRALAPSFGIEIKEDGNDG